jgi:hypothetical protein
MKRKMWLRLIGMFVVRLCCLLAVSAFLYALPEPETGGFVRLKNALVSFCTVIAIGTLIYNTFFYERYRM